MKIIRKGKGLDGEHRFYCKRCGCYFIADSTDYRFIEVHDWIITDVPYSNKIACNCPTCNELLTKRIYNKHSLLFDNMLSMFNEYGIDKDKADRIFSSLLVAFSATGSISSAAIITCLLYNNTLAILPIVMLFFVALTTSVIGISDMYSLMKYIEREYNQQQIEQSNRSNGIKCHIIHNNEENIFNKEGFGSIDIPIENNTHVEELKNRLHDIDKKYHMYKNDLKQMQFKHDTYSDIERENEEALRDIEDEIKENLRNDSLFDTDDGIIHVLS